MKALLSLIALSAFGGVVTGAIQSSPAPPIAYVSLLRISKEATAAKASAAKLESLRQEKAREVSAKQRAVETTHLQLVNAGGILQASKRAQLKAEEDRQRAELQHLTQQAQVDLNQMQRQLQADMLEKIGGILGEMAKRRGIQIVLNQDAAVVWGPVGADLSTQVIERLNER
jgi:outer membrane protein